MEHSSHFTFFLARKTHKEKQW